MSKFTLEDPPDMITSRNHGVWFKDPLRTPVDWADLRVSTQNMCRYNGAIHWTLVAHLALCATMVEERYHHVAKIQAGFAAAHDLHEVYCTDVVAGLKKYIPGYVDIEVEWEKHVCKSLGLLWATRNHELIKKIDKRALIVEMYENEHPGAEFASRTLGGKPTQAELKCFDRVAQAPPNLQWRMVRRAVEESAKHIEMYGKYKVRESYGK